MSELDFSSIDDLGELLSSFEDFNLDSLDDDFDLDEFLRLCDDLDFKGMPEEKRLHDILVKIVIDAQSQIDAYTAHRRMMEERDEEIRALAEFVVDMGLDLKFDLKSDEGLQQATQYLADLELELDRRAA